MFFKSATYFHSVVSGAVEMHLKSCVFAFIFKINYDLVTLDF